ncbi:MAG: MATE family efflux transporter [Muribaculaceae bacterium]|nr:MATE family efflux transporter [Muribaculaceae bacterium]
MQRDSIDLGSISIPRLFRAYFIPTLLGMLSLCAVTATDGIFVGRGVGSDGLAAVNICISPTMVIMGICLMLGVGASVVSSIHLARNNVKAARHNITQAIAAATVIVLLFLICSLMSPTATGRLLGSSETLMSLVTEYMPWAFTCCLFQAWAAIGLFVVRLDGSPRYAMWCNVIPGVLNAVLDYIFIFPLGMGLRGAGIATCISCALGGFMVIAYLTFGASVLRFIKIKWSRKSLALSLRNLGYQCKIGISAMLGEATMGMLMLMGNLMFMRYMGNNGVGAFSIACYYCPFVFMIGNAIAQSAQPIISYNYGRGNHRRVVSTERLAVFAAIGSGLIVTAAFIFIPSGMVHLFLDSGRPTAVIAVEGFPYFSVAFVFFIFNLTAIGYFQSVEKVMFSIIFALLRGVIFLVPAFILMPLIMGNTGIWMALAVSESLTSVCIIACYLSRKRSSLVR